VKKERTQFNFVEIFVQYAIKIYFCTYLGTNLEFFKAKCQIVVNELIVAQLKQLSLPMVKSKYMYR
jgi:hypothetical protein